MRQLICAFLVAAFAAIGVSAAAQSEQGRIVIPSPIMVIDFESVFNNTRYGKRIAAEITAERTRVQAELDQMAESLIAEESALTDARSTMEPEAFRAAAEAFDERAQNERATRETVQGRLVELLETEEAQFIERIQPIINEMMIERGAVVAMDRRSVIRAIGSANATDDAIALIDERLGDGQLAPGERPTLRPEDEGAATDDATSAPDLSGSD